MNAPVSEYIDKLKKFGFVCILAEDFVGESPVSEIQRNETFYCFWHYKYSVLVEFDTYTWEGDSIEKRGLNGGYFYYNINFHDDNKSNDGCTSSGGYTKNKNGKYIWCGHHDCRTSVKDVIQHILKYGDFLVKWEKCPVNSLCNYMDWKINGYDFNEKSHSSIVTKKRFASFPIEVQYRIGFISEAKYRKYKLEEIFKEQI